VGVTLRRKFRGLMYSVCIVKSPPALYIPGKLDRSSARPPAIALALTLLAFAFLCAPRRASADESASIHWGTVTEAQVKVDQTTPLTWGVYEAEKKGKPDKKLANLVLVLIGHRYLLIDLKAKRVYEVPRKELHAQGDGLDSGDLPAKSRLLPTSDWIWRNVGPAELYRVTLGDYGLMFQLTLPHPYLISPYF
jgi:hypothetical protein